MESRLIRNGFLKEFMCSLLYVEGKMFCIYTYNKWTWAIDILLQLIPT